MRPSGDEVYVHKSADPRDTLQCTDWHRVCPRNFFVHCALLAQRERSTDRLLTIHHSCNLLEFHPLPASACPRDKRETEIKRDSLSDHLISVRSSVRYQTLSCFRRDKKQHVGVKIQIKGQANATPMENTKLFILGWIGHCYMGTEAI